MVVISLFLDSNVNNYPFILLPQLFSQCDLFSVPNTFKNQLSNCRKLKLLYCLDLECWLSRMSLDDNAAFEFSLDLILDRNLIIVHSSLHCCYINILNNPSTYHRIIRLLRYLARFYGNVLLFKLVIMASRNETPSTHNALNTCKALRKNTNMYFFNSHYQSPLFLFDLHIGKVKGLVYEHSSLVEVYLHPFINAHLLRRMKHSRYI